MKKTYREPELEITFFAENGVYCDAVFDSNIGGGEEEERFFPIFDDEDE